MIGKHILKITFLNKSELFFSPMFQVWTYNSQNKTSVICLFLQQQLGPKIKDTSLVLMKLYIFIRARVQRKNKYIFSDYTFFNVKTETKQMHS